MSVLFRSHACYACECFLLSAVQSSPQLFGLSLVPCFCRRDPQQHDESNQAIELRSACQTFDLARSLFLLLLLLLRTSTTLTSGGSNQTNVLLSLDKS